VRQWTVDAFASGPFKGNPACVVEPFDVWPAYGWMQALAQENNQAETAFLVRTPDPARLELRWFTPTMEVPLCGHATLASAHVLLDELGVGADELTFQTRSSGELRVRRSGELYEMDFPADTPRRIEALPDLVGPLGAAPREVWAAAYLVVLLEDEAAVRGLRPDIAALHRVSADATLGRGNVVVTAAGDPGAGYDVVSRFFAPGSGVPEDPATGSAHCILTPMWAEKLGRSTLRCHQAFPGRGGDLECEAAGDRVKLRGRAVTTVESRLRLALP
jgi:predicted PhzF superfamily epimerase YddE/YHI9